MNERATSACTLFHMRSNEPLSFLIRSACAFLCPIGSRSYMTTSAPCIAWCIGIRSSVNRLAPPLPRRLSRTRDSPLSLNRNNYEGEVFTFAVSITSFFIVLSIKDVTIILSLLTRGSPERFVESYANFLMVLEAKRIFVAAFINMRLCFRDTNFWKFRKIRRSLRGKFAF